MIYVGIDVASQKHDFYIMDNNGIVYTKHSVTIPNTDEGYKNSTNQSKIFVEHVKIIKFV